MNNYSRNMTDGSPVSGVNAAVKAIEQCQAATRTMHEAFDFALHALLDAIPPLLPSVTNHQDRGVVDCLLCELAVCIKQPEPWVTPKHGSAVAPSSDLSSRIARDLVVTTIRVIHEQVEEHCSRQIQGRDLLQAAIDMVHAARAGVSDAAECRELEQALSKLEELMPTSSRGPGFVQCAGAVSEDDDLSLREFAPAAKSNTRTVH